MKSQQKKHSIDILFVLTLFCVLAISSLAVVYLGSNIYSKTVNTMDVTFNSHLVLDYLSEKVHQGNATNQITIKNMEGLDVLCIQSEYEQKPYTTYIYHDNKQLKELFIPSESSFKKENGDVIITIDSLSFQLQGTILQIHVSNDVQSHMMYLSLLR